MPVKTMRQRLYALMGKRLPLPEPDPEIKGEQPFSQPQKRPARAFLTDVAHQLASEQPVRYRIDGRPGLQRDVKVAFVRYDLTHWSHPTELEVRLPWHHGTGILMNAVCQPTDPLSVNSAPDCAVQWWEYEDVRFGK